MNRKQILNIHLYLALFFLPFLLLMPVTGGSYLLGIKGTREIVETFRVDQKIPKEEKIRDEWLRDQFSANNVDYKWESIKINGDTLTLRPSSRDYYVISPSGESTVFNKISPSFMARLMELHFGHGPAWFRIVEEAFALALVLITISGIWMMVMVKAYRKKILIPFSIGFIITLLAVVL